MLKFLLSLLLSLIFHKAYSQQLIDVADLTLKLGAGEQKELYYCFDSDDQLVLNFEEVGHKTLKSVLITEFATGTAKYEAYETAQIAAKSIPVYQKGIYKFTFFNAALLKGKVCNIKIQRQVGASGKTNFNTSVKWIERADTTYNVYTKKVVTGYREYEVQKSRRVLARTDTSLVPVANRVERVHSTNYVGGPNYSLINFSLPVNTIEPNVFIPDRTTEVLSWAYSIAVGSEGQAWYKNASSQAVASQLLTAAGATGGYGALALLAVKGLSLFSNPPSGENCIFSVLFSQNAQNYVLSEVTGNSVAASGRVTSLKQGSMTLKLVNDNLIDAINVDVKIIACVLTKIYKDELYTVKKRDPVEELKTFKEPKVAVSKVPVVID